MGRPNNCNCRCGKCYETAFVIAIYDESSPIYTSERSVYDGDLESWNAFVDEVKDCSGQKIRLGLMVPGGPLEFMKYQDSDWPRDTDRETIDLQSYSMQTPRLTSEEIVSFFDTMLNNPVDEEFENGPLLLLFVLDNSGSILLEQYAEELTEAKSILRSRFPDMKILDDISSSGERWLADSQGGISGKICKYTCCENLTCINDATQIEYDSNWCISEEQFNSFKSYPEQAHPNAPFFPYSYHTMKFCSDGLAKRLLTSQLEVNSTLSSVSAYQQYISYGSIGFDSLNISFNGSFSGTYPGFFIGPDGTIYNYPLTYCNYSYYPFYRIDNVPISATFARDFSWPKPSILPIEIERISTESNYTGYCSLTINLSNPVSVEINGNLIRDGGSTNCPYRIRFRHKNGNDFSYRKILVANNVYSNILWLEIGNSFCVTMDDGFSLPPFGVYIPPLGVVSGGNTSYSNELLQTLLCQSEVPSITYNGDLQGISGERNYSGILSFYPPSYVPLLLNYNVVLNIEVDNIYDYEN